MTGQNRAVGTFSLFFNPFFYPLWLDLVQQISKVQHNNYSSRPMPQKRNYYYYYFIIKQSSFVKTSENQLPREKGRKSRKVIDVSDHVTM